MTGKYRPDYFPGVPTIYVGLLNHPEFPKTDFSFVKGCVSGAAPLAVDTLNQWKEVVGAQITETTADRDLAPLPCQSLEREDQGG